MPNQAQEPRNTIEPVQPEDFLPAVIHCKMQAWRLVQLCATRLPGQYELSYSFAKGLNLRTLRLVVNEDADVPSITQIYPGAFLQENEVAELFGVRVTDMSQDYHQRLYRIARETPFKEKG